MSVESAGLPDAATIVRELRVVVSVGAEASPLARAAERLPTLLGLACVGGEAGNDTPEAYELTRGLVQVLRSVVRRLGGGPLGSAVGYLLGLDPEARGLSAERRRELAIDELFDEGMTAASFQRRHQDDVLALVADELIGYEEEYRTRQARTGLGAGDGIGNNLAIDWLRRFEHYYRIWNALSGLRNDLAAALERRWRDGQDPASTPYAQSSLWHYATFLVRLEGFVQDHGGLWLLSSIEAEGEVSEAIYWIGWHTPLAEIDDSWLRRRLVQTLELDQFVEGFDADQRGRDIEARWASFMRACECARGEPSENCQLHLVMEWCNRYAATIDAEWAMIASWYRDTRAVGTTATVDVCRAFDAFRYILPELSENVPQPSAQEKR